MFVMVRFLIPPLGASTPPGGLPHGEPDEEEADEDAEDDVAGDEGSDPPFLRRYK
jgi:hypothetical protein